MLHLKHCLALTAPQGLIKLHYCTTGTQVGEGRLGTGREGEGAETKGRTEMKREGMSGRVEEIRERRENDCLGNKKEDNMGVWGGRRR